MKILSYYYLRKNESFDIKNNAKILSISEALRRKDLPILFLKIFCLFIEINIEMFTNN